MVDRLVAFHSIKHRPKNILVILPPIQYRTKTSLARITLRQSMGESDLAVMLRRIIREELSIRQCESL
jgi:hypothetical protein